MYIYLSITKYASHLDLDPYKIMSSKQMSRSMSKSSFTYLFMILKSIIKYASHLDQFKMMSSNVAKWCHQMLHCCIATTVVLEPAICEDLDLHVAIFDIFTLTLLVFVGICLIIMSEWLPLSHWLLWFWWIVLCDVSVNWPQVEKRHRP